MQTPKTANKGSAKIKNPLEAVSDLSHSVGKGAADSVKNIGGGVMDSFFGGLDDRFDDWGDEYFGAMPPKEKHQEAPKPKAAKQELFHFAKHHEDIEVHQEIKRILEAIHEEIKLIDKQEKALLTEAKDIENIAINEMPENPGVYHIRFFETMLYILRSIRMKIGESGTWLDAMISKKKKRGSLFASRSKNQGTQYSMSQELQVTRSVQ